MIYVRLSWVKFVYAMMLQIQIKTFVDVGVIVAGEEIKIILIIVI